jgi:hypothetical protein
MSIYVLLAIPYGKPIHPLFRKKWSKNPPLRKVEPKFDERKTDIKIHKNIIYFFYSHRFFFLLHPHGVFAPLLPFKKVEPNFFRRFLLRNAATPVPLESLWTFSKRWKKWNFGSTFSQKVDKKLK